MNFEKVKELLKTDKTLTKKQACARIGVKPTHFYVWDYNQRKKNANKTTTRKTTGVSKTTKTFPRNPMISADVSFSSLNKLLTEVSRIAVDLQKILK